MSAIERAAIALHDLLWANIGHTDDYPLKISGDSKATRRCIRLLNELQEAIKASDCPHRDYTPKPPPGIMEFEN